MFNQDEFNGFEIESDVIESSHEELTLSSGRKSHWYANWRRVSNDISLLDKLAEYVLKEIPLFINGVKYKTENNKWKTYSLVPYPGLTSMDKLFIGLQNKEMFPELAERLKITDKIAILEAYIK